MEISDNTLPITESLQSQLGTPHLNSYGIVGDARVIATLVKEVDLLKRKLHELETQKILDETQFPREVLEDNNLLPRSPRHKRGLGYRPLLKREIEEAKKGTVNESVVARRLGVAFKTYKKYALLYGIYTPNQHVRGKRALFDPNRGKYPLNEILEGKHPNVELWTVKDKLLRGGVKKLKCEVCGFEERRIGDNKMPLLLNCMDGDNTNFKLENLKLMCFNCTFLAGRGYIRRGKFQLDPDWLQNEYKQEIGKPSRY